MASDGTDPPAISISRVSTESKASKASSSRSQKQPVRERTPPPNLKTGHPAFSPWRLHGQTPSSKQRTHSPDVEWHIKWTQDCFPRGRVLIIDYIGSEAAQAASQSGKRHIAVESKECEDLHSLRQFYADSQRTHKAALRVIHVQNARWATEFLLKKFNIDHPSEIVGMQGFTKWARYQKPRQRNGKPFPSGHSFREQTDPWRNISRTAFGLDYLKVYDTPPPRKRKRERVFEDKPVDVKMMHLNAYEDNRNPDGYDVSVQRVSVYVQRNLGPPGRVSPDVEIKNPYLRHFPNGHGPDNAEEEKVDMDVFDNTNTVIIFETSASLLLNDCLVQPRKDFEKRWRRLSFYLRKEEALNDARLAAQCTNMILTDVFHGLAVVWDQFLSVAGDHVSLLEDKIYENPADESRAPELWTNQAAWLKVDKIMWIHQDIVKEMQGHMRELTEVEDDEPPIQPPDWLAGTPAEYERIGHGVQEDLVQPTTNLSDLMYKSVGIRDSRQSLALGLSMWRLSWITFIFLPLTFIVGFFGMHVTTFNEAVNIGWYFLAAALLMAIVMLLWYFVKHSLERRRQTPYQRGVYEHLFHDLEDDYPLLWTTAGAVDDIQPTGYANRMKWRLLKKWFAPEKTVNKKLYSSLGSDADDADLGSVARFKRYLLLRWLPQILADRANGDVIGMAEMGSHRTSLALSHTEAGAVAELAKMSTPLAVAESEPAAVQQFTTYGLRPLSLSGRRRGSGGTPRQSSEERPSSRGSSGIMIEERNLSDSESDAGEGAHEHQVDGGKDYLSNME